MILVDDYFMNTFIYAEWWLKWNSSSPDSSFQISTNVVLLNLFIKYLSNKHNFEGKTFQVISVVSLLIKI